MSDTVRHTVVIPQLLYDAIRAVLDAELGNTAGTSTSRDVRHALTSKIAAKLMAGKLVKTPSRDRPGDVREARNELLDLLPQIMSSDVDPTAEQKSQLTFAVVELITGMASDIRRIANGVSPIPHRQ